MADSVSATPQNPALGALARALRFREQTTAGLNSPTGALLGLILPTAQTVERWSYGDPLFRTAPQGTGSRIPMTVRDKEYVAETLGYAPIGVPAKAAATGVMMTPPIGAIKPKGGNWLAGQVERAVEPLKAPVREPGYLAQIRATPDAPEGMYESVLEQNSRANSINKWLEQKLTKYIKNEMATPEDPVRLQADRWATEQQPKLLAEKQAQLDKAKADLERARTERGVDPAVLTKSQNRIVKLERERDEIAARTGLHIDLSRREFGEPQYRALQGYRTAFGYPAEATAASTQGKKWEDLADYYMQKNPAGDIIQQNYFLRDVDAKRIYDENPWLFKVPPETDVYSLNRGISERDTGFAHIVDELRNAMSAESDLPKNLQITAKDLDKMNIAQAVELVDKINAHRAANRSAMQLEQTLNADLYREYPEQGMRWVQLNREGQFKAESDAMGHSVRGYEPPEKGGSKGYGLGGWDAIQSGEAKVYSLRDAKGQPMVTIEVGTPPLPEKFSDLWDIAMKHVDDDAPGWDRLAEYGDDPYELFKQKFGSRVDDPRDAIESILEYFPEARDKTFAELRSGAQMITQIKGPKNQKPDESTMSFINDFIKSGNWSDIKDLEHTNLVPLKPGFLKNAADRNISADVITQINDQPYITKQEFNRLADAFGGVNKYPEAKSHGGAVGMAAGGAVMMKEGGAAEPPAAPEFDPARINLLADELMQKPAQETGLITQRAPRVEDLLRLSQGPVSVAPVRSPSGYQAQLRGDLDGVQPYVNVDPLRALVTRYGVSYEHPNPQGGYSVDYAVDPRTGQQVLTGQFRRALGRDSEVSASGVYSPATAGNHPYYSAQLRYRKTFATGGAVSADDYDEGKIQALADSILEELHG